MTADNPKLGALIDRLGLRERLVLAGPSDDVPAAMNGLDLHVLSSCAEGFPNVVAEAMACGVYCVVTDVGDAAYIVGDTGVVVPAEQAEALARGIETALREVAARGQRARAENPRARVLEHFDLARMVQSYIAVWRRISGVRHERRPPAVRRQQPRILHVAPRAGGAGGAAGRLRDPRRHHGRARRGRYPGAGHDAPRHPHDAQRQSIPCRSWARCSP